MENFILIISLLITGMILRRISVFPENTSQLLNQFVIYVSLPALVLLTVPQLTFSIDLLAPAMMPWIMLIFSAGLLIIFARILNWQRDTLAALLLIVPLGNTSFLGIPMVRTFFGEAAIPFALVYDQLGSFLALAIYGTTVLAIFTKSSNLNMAKVSVKNILFKIIIFPPFISLIIAMLLHFVSLPETYFYLLTPIAATLVPVVMVAVGFQLSLKLQSDKIQPFLIGLSIKMILAPALALAIFVLMGLHGTIYKVTVFEAAMPPMISAGALAIMANLSPKLTAAMLAYGIVLSFLTLPLLFYILHVVLP